MVVGHWHHWHNTLLTFSDTAGRTQSIRSRRQEILKTKDPAEHRLRLRLLKRAKLTKEQVTKLSNPELRFGLNRDRLALKLHKQQCKNCPWGRIQLVTFLGKETGPSIFTRKKYGPYSTKEVWY